MLWAIGEEVAGASCLWASSCCGEMEMTLLGFQLRWVK